MTFLWLYGNLIDAENQCEINYEITRIDAKEYTIKMKWVCNNNSPSNVKSLSSLKLFFLLLQAIYLIHVSDNVCFCQDESIPK